MSKHLIPWKRSVKGYKTGCQKVKHRLGPIKDGLTCLLSLLLTPFILRVPPGSCQGWTPAAKQSMFYMNLLPSWSGPLAKHVLVLLVNLTLLINVREYSLPPFLPIKLIQTSWENTVSKVIAFNLFSDLCPMTHFPNTLNPTTAEFF